MSEWFVRILQGDAGETRSWTMQIDLANKMHQSCKETS